MREFDWIEKINEENKTGEISISIEDYRNIRKKTNFKFIRGGITIIVGKNNVGKTNILDYIYECSERWNGFDKSTYEKDQRANYSCKYLPLFFGNDKPIFFERDEKISSLISADKWAVFGATNPILIEELNFKYFYKIFYLDLKTFFGFLENKVEADETPKKIKIGGCVLKFVENYDERALKRRGGSNSLMWKDNFTEQEESWKINYTSAYIEGIERVRESSTNLITYGGINESIGKPHSIANVGSGHLKFKKIKSLLNSLIDNSSKFFTNEIYRKILLVDELELLLHPPLIIETANDFKKLKENNITTIFSTHSPQLLSQFIHDEKVTFAILKSEKNRREKQLLGEIIYFWDLVKEIRKDIEKILKSYCDCLKFKLNEENEFYYNWWKSLLNDHTLKIFFTEKVLFVEGMSDYAFFTSKLMKNCVQELRKVEIIPIFSKSNYIFFKKLAENLRLDYWFLLDLDKHCIDEKKFSEEQDWEKKTEIFFTNGGDFEKCNSNKIFTYFWYRHRGELEKASEIDENKIVHSKLSRISWFPKNMEEFLFSKQKKDRYWNQHHWTRDEMRMSSSNVSEEIAPERFDSLKEGLKELLRLIEE